MKLTIQIKATYITSTLISQTCPTAFSEKTNIKKKITKNKKMQLPIEILIYIFQYQNKFFFGSKTKVLVNTLRLQSVMAKHSYPIRETFVKIILPINKYKCYEIIIAYYKPIYFNCYSKTSFYLYINILPNNVKLNNSFRCTCLSSEIWETNYFAFTNIRLNTIGKLEKYILWKERHAPFFLRLI